jgi:hypothetical protein
MKERVEQRRGMLRRASPLILLLSCCAHRPAAELPPVCGGGDEPFVLVIGHVKYPGKAGVVRGTKVMDVVQARGGFDVLAYRNGTTISRKACDGRTVQARVPLGRIADGELDDVDVAPGDVIMIPDRTF